MKFPLKSSGTLIKKSRYKENTPNKIGHLIKVKAVVRMFLKLNKSLPSRICMCAHLYGQSVISSNPISGLNWTSPYCLTRALVLSTLITLVEKCSSIPLLLESQLCVRVKADRVLVDEKEISARRMRKDSCGSTLYALPNLIRRRA